ncbi:Transposase, Ptta/En/Spm, plant [Corchorus capsularis]|uniref:Transposase, Ptta/En/Spm, plant n=1 Tax=Corchorus capsularis TaxID=210143 RepID=A0A1R3IW16_COCAP|nr:Transposase, Ptta/En/Spm, plant [Corchorus capsularis]
MDKSRIDLRTRANDEYIDGVINFLDFAFANSARDGKILCPCVNCVNTYYKTRAEAFDHIMCDGFLKGHVNWIFHGESSIERTSTSRCNLEEEDLHHDMRNLVNDALRMDVNMEDRTEQPSDPNRGRLGANHFYSLIKEAEENLYPTCSTFTKLSFMVHLYHIKCLNGWSNKSFTMLLKLLKDVLPEGNTLPTSFYEFKKIISALGLGYEMIHACPNDCMLFWKDNKDLEFCLKCGASRWKETEISRTNQANRLKLEEPHCTGTKSFARIIDEKTKDANGIPPSRAAMYILSRTKKDGTIVNQKAAEFMSGSSTQRNEEVLGLRSHITGLEEKLEKQSHVLNVVLELLNKRFPEENVNDVINEVINPEAADANSAPITRPMQTVPQIQVFNPTQSKEMNDED